MIDPIEPSPVELIPLPIGQEANFVWVGNDDYAPQGISPILAVDGLYYIPVSALSVESYPGIQALTDLTGGPNQTPDGIKIYQSTVMKTESQIHRKLPLPTT